MNTVVSKKSFLGVSKSLWRDPRTWLMLLAITERNIFRYMMLVLNMATGIDGIGVFVLHAAYIILIALCLQKGSRFHNRDILVMAFVVVAIFLTWLIHPANIEDYMFGQEQFWPTVFPLFRFFIVGLFLIPNEETVDLMGKVSCLALLAESMFVMLILRGSDLQGNDDMSRAYFILMTVLLVFNYAYDRRTYVGIVFAVVGILFLLSMGSRGPVMIVLAFIAAKVFQTSTRSGKGYIVVIALLLIMWFVNSDYWNAFLLFLREILSTLGFSTRIIDFAIEGETLTYYSERDEIYAIVWKKVQENPISGYGVYGEWQFVHWFAHNVYLEILAHYGVILGGVILLWLIYLPIKAFRSTINSPVRSLVLLFACQFFVRGFFGGSFLSLEAFLMIGFCFQIIYKYNYRYLLV